MYQQYWGLTESPFRNTLEAKFFYRSLAHQEAYSRLMYCLEERRGGAVVVGEYGTGKSMLCRTLYENLVSAGHLPVFIFNPLESPLELLREICRQARKAPVAENATLAELRRLVETDILDKAGAKDRQVVVMMDEAHLTRNLDVFEELRLMLNYQRAGRFLATIVLSGQPSLLEVLDRLPQLKQRLQIRFWLKPLDKKEVIDYISHRLKIAGARNRIFTREAGEQVALYSGNTPREINNICDLALLNGFGQKASVIDRKMIDEVHADLEANLSPGT